MKRAPLPCTFAIACAASLAGPGTTDPHIKIDQFGYRPADQKIALISQAQVGFNTPDPFTPGSTYEVRRYIDDTVAFSGTLVPWGSGTTHAQSGDKVWRFDFSSVTEVGSFYVYDTTNAVGSYRFDISDSVYAVALKQAVRAFYYQRCGAAKPASYAGSNWQDTACHVGTEQDTDCRWVLDTSPSTSKDLSGGWHDAGDYNKYVNFTRVAIHDLLSAYEQRPAAFGDDYGIPESGNGTPDVLDEVKVELDWFLKMQQSDGSALHKVSVTNFNAGSPPSTDTEKRRYAEATASATISTASAFAHGAIIFKALPDPAMQAYGSTLQAAAIKAWQWLMANPGKIPSNYNNQGFQNVSAEESSYEQYTGMVCAAAYLYVLTADPQYRTYFDANYQSVDLIQWGYAYTFEAEYQDGLLYYAKAPGATASVVNAIQTTYASSVLNDNLAHFTNDDDAYRAYLADADYVWGNNRDKSHEASMYVTMNAYGLDPGNATNYVNAASGYLHYLHGCNPLAHTYVSNMAGYGAESSVQEFYHGWFADGTVWDNATTSLYGPAPGFVPGGCNPSYAPDPSCGCTIEPPQNQPIQKSYKDWNTSFPEDSWEVTENSDGYQAAYVKLLSSFTSQAAQTGKEDFLTGAGLGVTSPNRVRVFDANGTLTSVDFLAYTSGAWGVNVAAGNIRGGANDDILTGPGPGPIFGPQVRAFRRDSTAIAKVNLYAYGTLKYGVNVGSAGLDGDAYREILSGAGPGAVFGPHVRGFNFDNATVTAIAKVSFFAYGTLKYGVNVNSGDVDADGFHEILTGPGPGAIFGPQVRGFNYDGATLTAIGKINFNAFATPQYGVNVAGGGVDSDSYDEIACAPGPGAALPSTFNGFNYDGSSITSLPGFSVIAFGTMYGGRVGLGDVGGGTSGDLVAGPGRDPAATSQVKAYEYTGSALAPLPVTFVAFSGTTYGVNATGADLGY